MPFKYYNFEIISFGLATQSNFIGYFKLINERSQIGTVQAVGYIIVRSPTKGHQQMPNQALELPANDTYHRHIFKTMHSTVYSLTLLATSQLECQLAASSISLV